MGRCVNENGGAHDTYNLLSSSEALWILGTRILFVFMLSRQFKFHRATSCYFQPHTVPMQYFLVRENNVPSLRYRRQQRILTITCSLCSFVNIPELFSYAESLLFLAHPSITEAVLNLRANGSMAFISVNRFLDLCSISICACKQVAAWVPAFDTDSCNSFRINNPVFFSPQQVASRVSQVFRCFDG